MNLNNTDKAKFSKKVKNKTIICFGSGQIFDKFLERCPIEDNVKYIVDNNPQKWGKKKIVRSREIEIISFEKALNIIGETDILLITAGIEAGYELYQQMESVDKWHNNDAYWSTFILADTMIEHDLPESFRLTDKQLIPKIIHYCWFGPNEIPEDQQEYIAGWKKMCPDYEIICWNEKNYDINKNAYMKKAYEMGKWGFVPDYIRKDVIYEYGGIYLDTDVEIVRNFDELLYQDGFCGFQEDNRVAFGLGFGARPELPIMKELRDQYIGIQFHWGVQRRDIKVGPDYETEKLQEYGLIKNGEYQRIAGLTVYPTEVLSGINIFSGKGHINSNTFAVHHFAGSWNSWLDSQIRARELYRRIKNSNILIG